MNDKEQKLLEQPKNQPFKIEVRDTPKVISYTKLDIKGKLFQNIIKMICYRVETTVAMLINEDIYKKQEESRSMIKSII